MRILHTSDWHLGRTFGPVSLEADQQAFVGWLLDEVVRQRVDLVVIAGDIYDRAVAPTDAVVLFRHALKSLQERGVRVAVITGNHDGADRVAAYHDLLDGSGVYLRGGYSQIGEVIALEFADGPLDLVLLPFLDPQAAPTELAEVGAIASAADAVDDAADDAADDVDAAFEKLLRRTHESVLRAAIEAAGAHLVPGRRSLAVSHAYVAGASTSDSERKLTIGGTGTVDAALFAPFSYTALGHLHRPQRVAGSDTIRYSGTPLAYSFSEDHPKSITVVEMAPDGSCTVEEVRVTVGRAVSTIAGKIDELLSRQPTSRERDALIRVILTDRGVVLDAKQRLSTVYPNIVEIIPQPEGVVEGEAIAMVGVGKKSAFEVAEEFWLASDGAEPSVEEHALLGAAIAKAEEVTA